MVSERRGEKLGWLGGWMGGFIWVAAFSVFFLAAGQWLHAGVGILLVAAAWASVSLLAPWKHPRISYWKLMLAPYAVFWGSVAWAIWSFGGFAELGLHGWWLFSLLPLLLPFVLSGARCWEDSGAPNQQGK